MTDNTPLDPEESLEEIEVEIPDEDEWGPDETPYDDFEGDQDAEREDEAEPVGIRGIVTPPSYVRTGNEAVQWALRQGSWHPSGMCQQFTRSAFNVASYYGSAASAWSNASRRHPTSNPLSVPRGVPVFFTGGSRGYGHAAVGLGNGYVRSTDWPYRYNVGTARISDIERSWGHHFVGWTEDINRVQVWEPDLPVVKAGNVARATRHEAKAPQATRLKKAVAAEVGAGNMKLNTGVLGAGFRTQYKLLQEKYLKHIGLRPTKSSADGIPGINSLTWLGNRHGFNVKP